MTTRAGVVAGVLIASALFGISGPSLGASRLGLLDLLLIGGGILLLAVLLRRRQAAPAHPMRGAVSVSRSLDARPAPATIGAPSSGGSGLDRGVRDIRRTDPGFDPAKFAGYAGMVFRDVQSAWMTRDIGSLRDRLTPEMSAELQAHCDRSRKARQSNRADRIEIRAAITEAWQEKGRDYLTAYIDGSMIDYTVDEVTGGLVHGSSATPREVEEFWTFTRPAGLNFWMLSAIQTNATE